MEAKQNENEFLEILSIIWDKKKLISLLVLFFSCVGFIYAFYVATPLYSSQVTFYFNSNNKSNNSQLLNIASQFGVGGVKQENSLNILDVIKSRTILDLVIEEKWKTIKYADKKVGLIDYWEIKEEHPWIKVQRARERLLEHTTVSENNDTGLITVTLQTEEAQLSADIVDFIVESANEYIKKEINKESKLGLLFIDQRLKSIEQELLTAENTLQEFRKKNRTVINSPSLLLTGARLERNVIVKQELFIALEKQKEIELIEVIKEEKPIVVLDSGEKSSQQSWPNRGVTVSSFCCVGFVFGIACSLFLSKKTKLLNEILLYGTK